jgi:hypothetical protein
MVRALFKLIEGRNPAAEDFTLAMALRHADDPIPVFLADVLATRELCGQAPDFAWLRPSACRTRWRDVRGGPAVGSRRGGIE